jgi:hypothetical protein
LDRLDVLDKKAEVTCLSPQEVDVKSYLTNRLALLLREEEIKWYQQAKTKNLLQGDANTQYFHLVANGKNRKTRIYQLEDDDRVIEGDANLKQFITQYYKGLFGPPDETALELDGSRRDDIPQVSAEENRFLIELFSEEEVRTAIFQMEHNKAPGSDGFPADFYQVFWEVIKKYLMAMFSEFYDGSLPLHSLNFGRLFFYKNVERLLKYSSIILFVS